MSSTHEALEQVEHAAHASDPFNQRVAVSMAIIAAILAGISMLGHRKHNEVLQFQGESNRLQTEASIIQTKANIDHTHATDQWGFYQAKNAREQMYTANLGLMDVLSLNPAKADAASTVQKDMKNKVSKYKTELPVMKADAEKMTEEGNRKQDESLKIQEGATKKLGESHHSHLQADRLDIAHLAAEIGLVVCSIALLTKKNAYWFLGVAAALVALSTATSAYLIPHDAHADHAPAQANEHPH